MIFFVFKCLNINDLFLNFANNPRKKDKYLKISNLQSLQK